MWGGGGIGSWEEGGRNGLDLGRRVGDVLDLGRRLRDGLDLGRRVGDVLDLGRRVVGMDWILGGGW